MAMMDEACLNVGNTTDKQLLDAMDSQLAQSEYYSSKKKDATKNKVACRLHTSGIQFFINPMI